MVAWKTETRKPEPPPKKFFILIFAAIIITLFFVMPVDAGAQVEPYPTQHCWIGDDGEPVCTSGIALTPFVPTATPVPAPTVAPTVTATPTVVIKPLGYFVYLSLIQR